MSSLVFKELVYDDININTCHLCVNYQAHHIEKSCALLLVFHFHPFSFLCTTNKQTNLPPFLLCISMLCQFLVPVETLDNYNYLGHYLCFCSVFPSSSSSSLHSIIIIINSFYALLHCLHLVFLTTSII